MSHSSPLLAAALILFAFSPAAARAGFATPPPHLSPGSAHVSIGGTPGGTVDHWEGGEPWATVVNEGSTGGTLAKKHIGAVQVSPLVLEFDFPPAPAVVALINEFFAGRATRKNIVVDSVTASLNSLPAFEAHNALLTEVRFPAFDGSASGTAKVTLVFAPESVQSTSAAAREPSPTGVPGNSFHFAIGSLDGSGIAKIEAFAIKSSGSPPLIGAGRDATPASGPLVSGNLVLTIRGNKAADWKAWFESFVVQGNSGDSMEKDGSITFRDTTGSINPVSLKFSHLGIVRLTQLPNSSGASLSSQVELYFEGLTLAAPPPPVSTTAAPTGQSTPAAPTSQSAPASNPATPAAATSDAQPAADTMPAPAAANPPAASVPAVRTIDPAKAAAVDQTALSPAPSARSAASTVPGTVVAGAPASPAAADGSDLGPRDPADFPRPDGLVRKSYFSSTGRTVAQESATYAARAGFDQVAALYSDRPKGAGWEETSRTETAGSSSGRTMIIEWRKAQKNAQVRLYSAKEGGTEISVSVTTQKSPSK